MILSRSTPLAEPSAVEAARAARFLLVRAGSQLCAVPLAHVVESMRPLPIERVAGLPPFLLGLAVIRGLPLPVVDLGALLDAGRRAAPARFVALRISGRGVALAVQAVLGVRDLAGAVLHDLPPLLRDADPQAIAAIGTLDAEFLAVLRTAQLVPEAAWQVIATRNGQR